MDEKTLEYIKRAKKVNGETYTYEDTVYTKLSDNITVTCKTHGNFDVKAKNHVRGRKGCEKCPPKERILWTTETIIVRFKEIHGDDYNYSFTIYKNQGIKIIIGCSVHGNIEIRPREHLEGSGCKYCAGKALKDIETVKMEMKKVHGETYDYSKVDYKDGGTNVEIICKIHGSFPQTPAAHKNGQGCPKCGLKKISCSKLKSLEDFISKWEKYHNGKYDYSKVIYTGCEQEVEIICPIHGSFSQTPQSHKTHGCKECAEDDMSIERRMTTEEFIEKANKKHKGKYDYSLVVYGKNQSEKVIIICPEHGKFKQRPVEHLQGKGCKKCSKKGFSIIACEWLNLISKQWRKENSDEGKKEFTTFREMEEHIKNVLQISNEFFVIVKFLRGRPYENIINFHKTLAEHSLSI